MTRHLFEIQVEVDTDRLQTHFDSDEKPWLSMDPADWSAHELGAALDLQLAEVVSVENHIPAVQG